MSPRNTGDWGPRRRPDLSAVAADDRLLDALGAGVPLGVSAPGAGGSADLLPGMLATWVDAIDTRTCDGRLLPPRQPHPAEGPRLDAGQPDNAFVISLPDPDDDAEDGPGIPKARRTAALAAVAATVGLFGLIQVEQAEPGSIWWPLVELLDGDRADSAVAQENVQQGLADVNTMMNDGRPADAAQQLEQLEAELPKVLPEDGQADLAAQVAAIHEQIAAMGNRPAGAVADAPAGVAANPANAAQQPVPDTQPQPAGQVPPVDNAGGADASGQPTSPTAPPSEAEVPPAAEAPAEPEFPSFGWALSLLFPASADSNVSAPPASSEAPSADTAAPAQPSAGNTPTAGPIGPVPTRAVRNGVPTVVIPTDVVPTDVVPTDALPTDALPTDALPTDALPTDTLPPEVAPTGEVPPEGSAVPPPTGEVPPTEAPAEPTQPTQPSQTAAPSLLPAGIPSSYVASPTPPPSTVPPPASSTETAADSGQYSTGPGMRAN